MKDKENKIHALLNRQKAAQVERKKHKLALERKYEFLGHPKADDLYRLAYDYGHSGGNSEIENYYVELSDLLTKFPITGKRK